MLIAGKPVWAFLPLAPSIMQVEEGLVNFTTSYCLCCAMTAALPSVCGSFMEDVAALFLGIFRGGRPGIKASHL
jgi:hydrogenase/urease accessory protein HupE